MTEIRSIMKPAHTVELDEFATKVRALVRQDERIIVVVKEKKFQGIITEQDAMLVASTKSNLKAREIMSQPLLLLTPQEEVHNVGRKMIEKDVYSIPVLKNSTVLGIVHMEDVLQEVYHPVSKTVQDIMTEEVVSCDKSESVTKVWDLMEYHDFTGIPVTREVTTSHRKYKKLEGIITRKDILRTGSIRPGIDRQRFTTPPPVEKAMVRTPKCVRPEDSVDVCVKYFEEYGIGRLPVIKNGYELVGIVDREDVLRLFV
jgi:CBS domain-containing protein